MSEYKRLRLEVNPTPEEIDKIKEYQTASWEIIYRGNYALVLVSGGKELAEEIYNYLVEKKEEK